MNTKVKKLIAIILALIILAGIGFIIFKKHIGGISIPSRTDNIAKQNPAGGEEVSFLKAPDGFRVSLYAKGLPGARVIEIDPKGRILVSETSEGKIMALSDTDSDGVADQQKVLQSGLESPHGMAFKCAEDNSDNCSLYVAERNQLVRFSYDADGPSLGKKEVLMGISSAITDHHFTRSLLFLPSPNEDTLLVSVGSSCNICNEKDTDHASILSYNIKTGKKEVYAKGLRNATFMALSPVSGKVFATEMGRDSLGDNIPPDEINIINGNSPSASSGQNSIPNFGWPICYGKQIHDTQFDKKQYFRDPCSDTVPSFIDLQAHSAPLGLSFVPESPPTGGWPEDYWYNMLVAYHGSWNRSTPTGYKIVRIKMNAKGEYLGTEDFITGFLNSDGKKNGRPVEIKILSGGVAYISDDSAGAVYKLSVVQ
ncbi:MAG TPA: PQQ-dependent sugar dehydrogenase [Candidatus Paceibacterota bacterium]|jgi:glucose/arabinose dehydrogenase|nr:PQQ-dependent sugar dehydrogenase [Candidatus Paceibacterota bacterium]